MLYTQIKVLYNNICAYLFRINGWHKITTGFNNMKEIDNSYIQEQEHGTDQYLTFILGEEEYGVNILKVQEIRGWDSATSIPNTPDYVLGVVNLRGVVVPIIDMRKRFNLDSADFGPTTVVVIVKAAQSGKERTVGMVVDAISDVYNVDADDIRDAPDLGSLITTEFVTGLTTVDEKMVILLNIDLLINSGVLEVATEENETAEKLT